ncbi:MAG TPA: sulfurtransferase [Deltaproteobacteria bacterium]|nr:sulfurtransferase [Deltaproteobacteria bacterium]HPJ94965.1 sulfurtransferase [Deltaproteobacteria bacterium]
MKNLKIFAVIAAVLSLMTMAATLMARDIDPIVSAQWLEDNLAKENLVIIDIRKVEEYKAGHIPGSINIFYNILAPGSNGLQNELPEQDDLVDVLSSKGISTDSLVVIAGKTDSGADKVNTTRVGLTLIYAGVPNVAVLNGGYNKWTADNRKLTTEATEKAESDFDGEFNETLIISKEDLVKKIGTAVIVDTREAPFYTGEKKLEFVARAGHIKSAVNLPTISQVFNDDGTYKDMEGLKTLAAGVIGGDTGKEIITYCDSGRVATTWWYLLREVFGYKNVRLYDGSAQDWAKDEGLPMEK